MDYFGSKIPLEILADYISDIFHAASHSKAGLGSAIFVSVMLIGYDDILGTQLYTVEPDGRFNRWNAIALGKHSDKIMKTLSNFNFYSEDEDDEDISRTYIDDVDIKQNNNWKQGVDRLWSLFRKGIIEKYFWKENDIDDEDEIHLKEHELFDWDIEVYVGKVATKSSSGKIISNEMLWKKIDFNCDEFNKNE